MRIIAITTVVCLLACCAAAQAGFDGSLSFADGGLVANGFWADNSTTLSWNVSPTGSGLWNYSYSLHVPRHAVSHLILETSVDLPASEITNITGSFIDGECWEVGWFETNKSNPGMPDEIYGIKFELGGEYTDLSFSFDCARVPVWGDFYAKNGVGGGEPSTLWNAGFALADPVDPVSSGSLFNHVIRPDTATGGGPPTDDSPEPATWLLLLATGIVGAGRRWRRARRSGDQ